MNDDLYLSNGNEVQLFEWAYAEHMPVMLTGPTGCGKTPRKLSCSIRIC